MINVSFNLINLAVNDDPKDSHGKASLSPVKGIPAKERIPLGKRDVRGKPFSHNLFRDGVSDNF